MLWIVPFLVLVMILWGFLLFIGGIVKLSGDSKKVPVNIPVPKTRSRVAPAVKSKAYIELTNGTLIELLTKAEETQAKKDGFKVVYK